MEIVAHTIGGGLEHNHGLGFECNAATHAAHHFVGVVHHTRRPKGGLAQVGHRDVIAPHGILAAGTAREYQAIPSHNLMHVGLPLKFPEGQLLAIGH